jgi:hypothetical protein
VAKLSAVSIASFYTAEEIAVKIAEYQQILDSAASGSYRLDTTSGAQSVTPPDLGTVSELLQVYLKAYQLKSGTAYTRLISVDYHPQGGPF